MTEDEEQAEMDAAWERSAEPHPRDLLKAEHDRMLKGHPRDVALEKWGPELEEMIMRDLRSAARRRTEAQMEDDALSEEL
jgi:hypothetical protein